MTNISSVNVYKSGLIVIKHLLNTETELSLVLTRCLTTTNNSSRKAIQLEIHLLLAALHSYWKHIHKPKKTKNTKQKQSLQASNQTSISLRASSPLSTNSMSLASDRNYAKHLKNKQKKC